MSVFVFVTPEGFTTMVANEGLEKARAHLNQVPGTDGFTSPPKDAKLQVKTPSKYTYLLFGQS